MIKADEKVINLVEKIRRALREGKIKEDTFPMDEMCSLIACTMGKDFWDCVGSRPSEGFSQMPEVYKACLERALKQGDLEECEHILQLFECSYQAFYTAMNEEEKLFREKPYRQMIIDLGMAAAQIQYRLHRERQKAYSRQNTNAQTQNFNVPVQNTNTPARGRGVVYTCLFGDEKLNQPKEISAKLEYLCFTDQSEKWGTKEGVWQYCKIENEEDMEERLIKSRYRIMAHELLSEYDYSIWVDSDIMITGDLLRFCAVYGEGNSFLAFPNAEEDCIYEDMSVTQMGTDDLNIRIRKAMVHYKEEGYPEHNGLIDSRVMIRNHRDKSLCEMMEGWWKEIHENASIAENLFNYMAWKYRFPFSISNLFIYENPYVRVSSIDLDTNEEL